MMKCSVDGKTIAASQIASISRADSGSLNLESIIPKKKHPGRVLRVGY